MMKKTIAVAVAIAASLALAACGDAPDPIDRGKRCADLGGSWEWSEWTGYHCEFVPKDRGA
jgi:ABC-type glycerol-3-phosphate transport system substrate-binding protein